MQFYELKKELGQVLNKTKTLLLFFCLGNNQILNISTMISCRNHLNQLVIFGIPML